jgi:hypothetical protein
MATKRTPRSLPTVNICVADGRGNLEMKPVTPLAVAGAWAVTPCTFREGLFTVTCRETGMGVGFQSAPLAVAKRAIEALAAHMSEDMWRRLARVLSEHGSMSQADRALARSVNQLAESFAPTLKVTVLVDVEDDYVVTAVTRERIKRLTSARRPRAVELTPAQLARHCPRLLETQAAVPSDGPDALWYALRRARQGRT